MNQEPDFLHDDGATWHQPLQRQDSSRPQVQPSVPGSPSARDRVVDAPDHTAEQQAEQGGG